MEQLNLQKVVKPKMRFFKPYKVPIKKRMIDLGWMVALGVISFVIYWNSKGKAEVAGVFDTANSHAVQEIMQKCASRLHFVDPSPSQRALIAGVPVALAGSPILLNGKVPDYSFWFFLPAFAGRPTDSYGVIVDSPNAISGTRVILASQHFKLTHNGSAIYGVAGSAANAKPMQYENSQVKLGDTDPGPSSTVIAILRTEKGVVYASVPVARSNSNSGG